jgi:hypothetical protein
MYEDVIYDIAWSGLRNSLRTKVGLMTPAFGRYHSSDEFRDNAAALHITHVENTKPQQQQPQQQEHQQKQAADSSSKGCKQGYQRSIMEPADTNGRGKSCQSGSTSHGNSGSREQS